MDGLHTKSNQIKNTSHTHTIFLSIILHYLKFICWNLTAQFWGIIYTYYTILFNIFVILSSNILMESNKIQVFACPQ